MTLYLSLFGATLALVATRAFQQLNVFKHRWLLIPPTSYIFATTELWLFLNVVGVATILGEEPSFQVVLYAGVAMGTGGWMGCFLAMWLQGKL
jgi:hypothetical protein